MEVLFYTLEELHQKPYHSYLDKDVEIKQSKHNQCLSLASIIPSQLEALDFMLPSEQKKKTC